MTQFSGDLFTGTNDTSLISHTSDSSHSWAYSGIGVTAPSTPAKIFSNALSFASSSGEHVPYYSSATPAAPEYSVTATVTYNGATADLTGPVLGLAATSVTGSSHGYLWHISPQTSGFRLRRYDGATPTQLAAPAGTITSGVSYVMTIDRAAAGAITCRVQRLSDNFWMNSSGTWGASQVNAVSVTDTTYTAADRPGISTYATASWSTIDNFSADETATDTTAPTLSSPGSSSVGSTTVTGNVTTDEANGTLYCLVTANATETAATVKATGTTQAITTTGAKSINITGLTASTTYYAHFCHRDAAGNDSTVSNSASFTTSAAAATATTLSGPSSGTTGVASTNFTVGANGAITGTVIVTPADGGAGGTFTPTTVSISSGSPTGTFAYTPASTGVKTISVSDNGGLTDATSLSYTSNAASYPKASAIINQFITGF